MKSSCFSDTVTAGLLRGFPTHGFGKCMFGIHSLGGNGDCLGLSAVSGQGSVKVRIQEAQCDVDQCLSFVVCDMRTDIWVGT